MTTAPTPVLPVTRSLPWLDRVRDVPLRYWLVAAGSGLLVWAGHLATPGLGGHASYADSVALFFGGMWKLAGLLLLCAPLVALWRPLVATALCLAPFLLNVIGDRTWPFTCFAALVAVAIVATWRSPRIALVPAVLSLAPIVVLATGHSTMVMPYGSEISFGYGVVNADGVLRSRALDGTVLVVLTFYVVAVGIAYGTGLWMRSSALKARRLSSLTARAGAVEDQAVLVAERARLARDLHDVVAHHVSLIAVRAETAPYTHLDLGDGARHVLAEIATEARAALDELRGVLGVLRRSDDQPAEELAPQPDLAGVAALVERTRAAGAKVSLEGDLRAPVAAPVGYVAYRVVQEALTNARRHASGQPVAVSVLAEGDRVRVRVSNPYLEESRDRTGGGGGLVGMRERVEALGGKLRAGVEGDLFVAEADLPRGAA